MNLSAIASNVATTSTQVDFYFQLLPIASTATTSVATSTFGACTSASPAYGCNNGSNIYKATQTNFQRNATSSFAITGIPYSLTGYQWAGYGLPGQWHLLQLVQL